MYKIKPFAVFIICLLLTASACVVKAQNPSFVAEVSPSYIAVGDQFQLTFTFNGNASQFIQPNLGNFKVLSGPNQAKSVEFNNGTMTQTWSFSYILLASQEGVFKIGPAGMDANGKRYNSNIVTIKVDKAGKQAATKNNGAQGNGVPDQIGNNILLKVNLNKTQVTQGEEIIATYKIYFKVGLVNYNLDKLPATNGFWSQELTMPGRPQIKREVIDGVAYNVADIRKVILYPQQSGALELAPMELTATVRVETQAKKRASNDIFDQLFNDPFFNNNVQDVNYKIKSNLARIQVKPLPANAPDGFCGLSGKLSVEATMDRTSTKSNEPVSLKIKVSGKGNLKLLEPIKLNLPPDIESYDPKITDNIVADESGMSGSRTFEYLLIPRNPGTFKLDPIAFSYFDLSKNQYVSIPSKEFTIEVAKGSGDAATGPASSSTNKEDVQLLGKDIRYIKVNDHDTFADSGMFFGSWLYDSLLVLPLILFSIFIWWYNKNKALQGNVTLLKSQKANKIALKRLANAKHLLAQNQREAFYDDLSKALLNYISDKLAIPMSQLSKDFITHSLQTKGISDDIIFTLNKTMDDCEFARFAPGGHAEMEDIYQSTVNLITHIEQGIKS